MNKTLKNTTLKILVSQQNFTVGSIENNAQKIISIIHDNQAKHDLILFPELALTGYPPEDLLFRDTLHQRVEQSLKQIAQATKNAYVIVGHPLIENEHCYNAASIFHNGQCIQIYRKQQLPNFGVFDEKRYFEAGPLKPCLFTIKGHHLGLCICEDIWHPETVDQHLHAHTALLLCMNASPYDAQKYARRMELLQEHAQKGLSIIYVNLIGGQDDLIFDGQSLGINPDGTIGARLPAFREDVSTFHYEDNRITGPMAPLPSSEAASIYDALVLGTRDYINKHGFPGVIIGLSGGIDSALTLAIAVDALGAERVHGVLMPSRYTASMSNEDAETQAHKMGVKTTRLPIEPLFETLLHTLAEPFKGLPTDTTEENCQARIRGILLMALSNKTGKIVLTTSNKSETAVGYATLYGDMAGGYAVLKDVLKTQVYELAVYRNTLSAVIPERVLTRAPSAELREQQTDQDSLPPYPILDAIIQSYVEDNQDAQSIIAQGFSDEVVRKVIKLIKQNEYKRRQSAPGPKVSTRAFSRDWRYPITNQY